MTLEERKAAYEQSALKVLTESQGHEICTNCYCCELVMESAPCWQCGGFDEDEEDELWGYGGCSVCKGERTLDWKCCIGKCDENGNHGGASQKERA